MASANRVNPAETMAVFIPSRFRVRMKVRAPGVTVIAQPPIESRLVKSFQQGDSFPEGLLEVDFACHGGRGYRRDLCLRARLRARRLTISS